MEGVIGLIWMFAGNFAPRAWAFCDGRMLAISGNSALFSILGTTYGGDGRTTFGLPDMRGRAPMHAGTGPGLTQRRLGEILGTETVTLNAVQIPSHNHATAVAVSTSEGAESSPAGQFIASNPGSFNEDATDGQFLGGVPIGNTGGLPHNNMQPFLAVNFVICLQGIYPSRN